jgi:glycosyltransferase involved in cell wall biosynthesis
MAETAAAAVSVQPLDGSMRMLLLPDIAAKLALGWKAVRVPEGVSVMRTRDDAVVMNEADFDLCRKVAERIVASGLSPVDPSGIIEACGMARKMIVAEVFAPGTVRVLYYPSITRASAFYRCLLPSLTLNRGDKARAFVSKALVAREAVDYDVVVIQIDHSAASFQFASALKSLGKKVVYEIDDAFDQMEEWHPRWKLYRRPEVRDSVFRMMELADAVVVPTRYLADRYAGRTRRVVVIPNMIDVAGWPVKVVRPGPFRILWAGSPSHEGDLAVAKDALLALGKQYPSFRFTFFGHMPEWAAQLSGQADFIDFVPFEEYPVRYAQIGADVVIAPLADIPFNRAKSPIRLMEAGASGYAVVASKVGTYAEVGEDTIPLCVSTDDWVQAVEAIHLNPEFRSVVESRTGWIADRFDSNLESNRKIIEDFFVTLIGR